MPEQSSNKQEFRCKQCGKVMQSQNELQEHQKTHQGQQQSGTTHQAGGGHSGH